MLAQLRAIKILGWRNVLSARKLKRFNQESIRGFYTTRAIITLFNVGFFAELAERPPIDLATFAAAKGLDLTILSSLCDYLYILKILNRDQQGYTLSRKGEMMVSSLSGAFHLVHAYEDIFSHLECLLKQEKQYGVDLVRRSEFVAKGSGSVGNLLAFPMIADLVRRHKFARVLDLGCGDASFLIALCETNPRIIGYGLDISPEAIAAGQANLAQARLQDRVHLFTGDLLKIDTLIGELPDVDAATCIYVLHEFLTDDPARILSLLNRFKQTFPGVPLIICEVIRHTPETLRRKPGGLMEIQLFHELSNQRLNSREEWIALFKQAGFKTIQEDYLAFARTAIYRVS